MEVRDWTCFAVVVISTLSISRICFGYDDEGFQYWSKAGISFDINKDWECTLEEEFKFGDDGGYLYKHSSDLGFLYKGLADWIDIGFNYKHAFEKDGKGEWREEHRPHLNITLKGRLFDLDVSNRSRFEYRDMENKKDVWRSRNKFTVKLPFELTPLKLKPYLADEVFITLDDDNNIDKNRLYFGVSFNPAKNIKADIFYLWQSSKSAKQWKDINVLGTRLKFLF